MAIMHSCKNLTLPVVTTFNVSEVTQASAVSGGNVKDDGGSEVTSRGICYGTSHYPTINDERINDYEFIGRSFLINVSGLIPSTNYYVRAFATNSEGTSYGDEVVFRTYLADVEGNLYKTVEIGTQVWMAENLKTTKFNDGSDIPLAVDNTDWHKALSLRYCWFNNDKDTYGNIYGALYNGFVISTSFNGNKNVCPTGWHVPTEAEWYILENYLIAKGYNYDGTTTGDKIAKSLASTTAWKSSTNQGAVGNTDYPEKRNITGFSALPAGDRQIDGRYLFFGTNAVWWNSTGDIYFGECCEAITYESVSLISGTTYPRDHRYYGLSVRCLKD